MREGEREGFWTELGGVTFDLTHEECLNIELRNMISPSCKGAGKELVREGERQGEAFSKGENIQRIVSRYTEGM